MEKESLLGSIGLVFPGKWKYFHHSLTFRSSRLVITCALLTLFKTAIPQLKRKTKCVIEVSGRVCSHPWPWAPTQAEL